MNWDYVIVGGGSAGCVLAARLSEDGKSRVLLIEAGPRDRSPYIHVPAGLVKLQGFHWGYQDEPDPSRMDQQMVWMAGKVLGGGSSVNGMVWVRGNPADYDHWADLGCSGWRYDDLLSYFKKSETYECGEDAFRGGHGPQRVGGSRVQHELTDAFIESANDAGFPANADYNGRVQEGIGVCQTNQRRGFRHSAARAYLGGTARRRNLDLLTSATVTRILFEGTRAVGVELERDGHLDRVIADQEVIVSAGALASPKILMVSGIGEETELRKQGIPVIAHVPGVGKNLQEHPIATMLWNVNVPTLNMDMTPKGVARHGLNFALHGRGAAASAAGHALLFAKLHEDSPWPEIEGLFAPYGMVGANAGDTSQDELEGPGDHDVTQMQMLGRPSFTVIAQLLHPRSRGAVELRSPNPRDMPVIRHRLMDEEDIVDLTASCRIMREIVESPPLSKLVVGEALPGTRVQTDQDWEQYLRMAAWGAQHPVGT
ncbi:MAG TPA: GMC family oxidoreductase N-terminal domain-containing protein, partial [Myxococcota bacterium]|nr:GMC family oxidoreductase N-terminal domain-containing protein [Myxococcota bacterium]